MTPQEDFHVDALQMIEMCHTVRERLKTHQFTQRESETFLTLFIDAYENLLWDMTDNVRKQRV